MELDFRGPIPPRETSIEKAQRVKRERQQAQSYNNLRLDLISHVYSIPLKEEYLGTAFEIFAARYGKLLVDQYCQRATRSKQSHNIKGEFFEVNNHGDLKLCNTPEARQKAPVRFYRNTKLVAWRFLRQHQAKLERSMTGRVPSMRSIPPDTAAQCAYQKYLNKIADIMHTNTSTSMEMERKFKRSTCLMLTPYAFHAVKKDLCIKMLDEFLRVRSPKTHKRNAPAAQGVTEKLTEEKTSRQSKDSSSIGSSKNKAPLQADSQNATPTNTSVQSREATDGDLNMPVKELIKSNDSLQDVPKLEPEPKEVIKSSDSLQDVPKQEPEPKEVIKSSDTLQDVPKQEPESKEVIKSSDSLQDVQESKEVIKSNDGLQDVPKQEPESKEVIKSNDSLQDVAKQEPEPKPEPELKEE